MAKEKGLFEDSGVGILKLKKKIVKMKGYLTYCYCKQNSEKFERLDEKIDPNFKEGKYSVCHRDIRERIQVGDFLFLRTNWRNCPYLVGYYEISEKYKGKFGPVLLAKNRICVDFNLPIDAEILHYLRPELKIDNYESKRISWAQYVNYALGHRKYIVLGEEKTQNLAMLIKQGKCE